MDNPNQQQPATRQPIDNQILTNNILKQRSNLLIILAGISLVLTLGTGTTYYLAMIKNKPAKQFTQQTYPTPTRIYLSPTPSSVDLLTFPEKKFKKRLFNVNDNLYGNIGMYPEELRTISENDLIPLFCYNLKPDDKPGIYYYSDNEYKDQGLLVDKKLQDLFKQLSIPTDPINTILGICEAEDGRLIVRNEIQGGGGGGQNKALFYVFDTTNKLNYVTTIPNDGAAYFTCIWPLQLTKTNFLYYGCGGGDGPSGSRSIYQINLNNNTNAGIYKCGTYYDEAKKEINEKCETFVNW